MAERFSQKGRGFRVETPLSGKEELLLEGFSGVEGVSQLFKYTLEFASQSSSIDPDSILREPLAVFVQLADGSERAIHGVASRFTQRGRSEELQQQHDISTAARTTSTYSAQISEEPSREHRRSEKRTTTDERQPLPWRKARAPSAP
jgi:uncharacterized protein involved in type VI secretion and phage assembly